MNVNVLVIIYWLVTAAYSDNQERRDPKWFLTRRTLTSVMLQRRLVTEMIPSSCAVVEPTLQPCRNVRGLDIKPTPPKKIRSTEAPTAAPLQMLQPLVPSRKTSLEPSADGGSWFWGGITTVTQILVSDVTVKLQDPNTVVTFSVKGCKPTRLPFDLPYCKSVNVTHNNPDKTSSQVLRTADLHYIQD